MIRYDMNGMPFEFESYDMSKNELLKIVHEINSVYHMKYKEKKVAMHRSIDTYGHYSIYYFEIRGFGDYNIYEKIYD